MRIFLIIVSFVNTLFYVLIYAYYDNILDLLGASLVSAGFQNFIKIMVLIIIGFSIGTVSMLFLDLKGDRSYFDFKNLILLGIVPFFLLILSQGPVTNFITTNILGGSNSLQELVFYLLSRQILWALWLGVSVGTSIRPHFGKNRRKHEKKFSSGSIDIKDEKK